MVIKEQKIEVFQSGIQNTVSSEIISKDASKGSLNWLTKDGRIQLAQGRQEYGTNTKKNGSDADVDPEVGAVYAQKIVSKEDGTKLHYRKINDRIQVYEGGKWLDVIQNLSDGLVFFAPYTSLAGNFLFIGSPDGLYKIHLANSRSYKDMFDSAKNHKGYILINESRIFLWNRFDAPGDKTALYVSKIDPQGTNYTDVSGEVLGVHGTDNYTGTFSAMGTTKFCFNITITGTTADGVETFRDDKNGLLTSDKGGTGTIDYSTGVYDITFNAAVSAGNVEADYQWEDSNVNGITDFTFSTPRVAGEGDFFSQEYLGEPILNVIPFDNKYYSFKESCVYELELTIDDTNASNTVYRSDIGILSRRGVVATGKGIAYMDVANEGNPRLSMLIKNPIGGDLEPIDLTPQFSWDNYRFSDCIMDTWGEYIMVSAKTPEVDQNNRLFLVNTSQKYIVDTLTYGAKSFAKDGEDLFIGSSLSEVVYQILTQWDDLGEVITNFWLGKDDNLNDDRLKRVRYLELKGLIDPSQNFEVYLSYDDKPKVLIGTIMGNQDYVNLSSPKLIEPNIDDSTTGDLIGDGALGSSTLGGSLITSTTGSVVAYPFHTRLKIRTPKFRTRRLIFVAKGYGFCGIELVKDFDILYFEQRIPKANRMKEYVSKDGTETNLDKFEY